MNRTRKIVIACVVAIITTLILSYINSNYLTETKYDAYALKETVIAGEHIQKDMLEKVQVSESSRYLSMDEMNIYIEKSIAKETLNKGQILTKDIFEDENNIEKEKLVYVSIPISNVDNSMAYQVTRGNLVNVYYTAKQSLIAEATKGYEKEYSSSEIDGMLTVKILENAVVVNAYNETGQSVDKTGPYRQLVFKTNEKTAMIISNLKGQGVFDICLVR